MEQPDVVFSVEQLRHGRAEPHTCDSDPDSEHLTESSQTEDSDSSGAAQLFFELKEKPEELLQLAPEAGDVVPLTGETVQRPTFLGFSH